jgi:hypothetical protein
MSGVDPYSSYVDEAYVPRHRCCGRYSEEWIELPKRVLLFPDSMSDTLHGDRFFSRFVRIVFVVPVECTLPLFSL